MRFTEKTAAEIVSLNRGIAVNKAIGKRLSEVRAEQGLKQAALAAFWGITFQQVQKYENSTNRLSAARLHSFLAAYEISYDHFFEGLDIGAALVKRNTRQDINLYNTIRAIPDGKVKTSIITFIHDIVRAIENGEAEK